MIKKLIGFILPLLILSTAGVGTPRVYSADRQDRLTELDSYMKTGKLSDARAPESIGSQLIDHFSAELELRCSYFVDSPSLASQKYFDVEDDDHWDGQVRANWSSWTGKDRWNFHAAGWFTAGTGENEYGGVTHFMTDTDNKERYAELNELFFTLSYDAALCTVGKKIFKNGISTIYSPADRYTSADLSDPLNPIQIGSWQLACDYSRGDTVYTGAVLPFYQEKKASAVGSRWINTDLLDPSYTVPGSLEELEEILSFVINSLLGDSRFVDLLDSGKTIRVREELPDNDPGDWGWFGRVKTSVGMWDAFVSGYYGPAFYPVIRLEETAGTATLIKETPNVYQLAGGFSTTWGNTEFHGEALYSYSCDERDESYINYVGGLCHSSDRLASVLGLKKIDLGLEYAGECITDEQDDTDYILGSKYGRIGRNDLIASLIATVTDDLSLHYLSDFTLSDEAYFQRIGASLRVVSGVVLTLDLEFFSGPLDTYFGKWRNNDRVVSSVVWSL